MRRRICTHERRDAGEWVLQVNQRKACVISRSSPMYSSIILEKPGFQGFGARLLLPFEGRSWESRCSLELNRRRSRHPYALIAILSHIPKLETIECL